uniref:Uncharacterized protein n=1 Tax=Cacopsylla melanoneura TaxID=428564 RepID=A0A8D8ZDG3_9HEMI
MKKTQEPIRVFIIASYKGCFYSTMGRLKNEKIHLYIMLIAHVRYPNPICPRKICSSPFPTEGCFCGFCFYGSYPTLPTRPIIQCDLKVQQQASNFLTVQVRSSIL